MKGNLHLLALAVVVSFLTINEQTYAYMIGFFIWLCYLFYKKRFRKLPFMLSFAVYLFFIFYFPNYTFPQENSQLSSKSSILGEISSPPVIKKDYIHFILKERMTNEKIIIHYFPNGGDVSKLDISSLKYGAQCQLNKNVTIPDGSRNPGEFDYQDYLAKQGIFYESTINSDEDIYCQGSKWLHLLYNLRIKLIQTVTNFFSDETSSWLKALVLGDDSSLQEEVVDLFQRWSLTHLLAISGLHISLITALLYFLLVKLNIVTKETATWVVIFFLPFYAFLAGGAPSVWRASFMSLLILILLKARINISALDVLSMIFILLILIDRYIMYNIGFQFSFLVTFGLILSRQWILEHRSPFWQLLKISFIAQMIIVPLQIIYFSTFHPLSILINFIIVPYFSLFVIPAMFLLLIIFPILPRLASLFDQFFSLLQTTFLHILEYIDNLLYFPFIIGDLSPIAVVFYYIFLIVVMYFLEKKQLQQAFRSSLFIVFLLCLVIIQPYIDPKGTVTMLDIGQGDAYVIELPFRKGVFLVDAGATNFSSEGVSEKTFAEIIQPYLYKKGIQKIDAIFISHEDLDHNGSIPLIVEEMNVDKIVVSEFYEFSQREKEIIAAKHVQIERTKGGNELTLNGHSFKILSPTRDRLDANDNSLVLQTTLGGKSWLFTGDISKDVERKLLQDYPHLHVDVLKVAHHGSHTSTEEKFIQKIAPEYALISTGVDNRYGHPTEEVISTLIKEGVIILRTDMHGAVQYRFQHNDGVFYKYLP